MRNASHFGRAPTASYRRWRLRRHAVRRRWTSSTAQLRRLAGRAAQPRRGRAWRARRRGRGPYAERSMADLVLHIHRELIHHLSEVLPASRPLRCSTAKRPRPTEGRPDGPPHPGDLRRADPAGAGRVLARRPGLSPGRRVDCPRGPILATWDEFLEAFGVPPEHRNDPLGPGDPDGTAHGSSSNRCPRPKSAKNRVHLDVRAAPGPRGRRHAWRRWRPSASASSRSGGQSGCAATSPPPRSAGRAHRHGRPRGQRVLPRLGGVRTFALVDPAATAVATTAIAARTSVSGRRGRRPAGRPTAA